MADAKFIEFRDAFLKEFHKYLLCFRVKGEKEINENHTVEEREYDIKVANMYCIHAPYAFEMVHFAYNHFVKEKDDTTEDVEESAVVEDFDSELNKLLNRFSMENKSNTPDYLLTTYLTECLSAFNRATQSSHLIMKG